MEWVLGTLAAVAAVAVLTAVIVGLKKQAEQRQRDDEARLVREDQQRREDAEARAAPLLVEEPDREASNAIVVTINALLAEFKTLTTFQDVESWDSRAEKAVADADEAGRALAQFVADTESKVAEYRARNSEPRHISVGRIEKTVEMTRRVAASVNSFAKACDLLQERVEMTPNNKKDQSALLRELRAEKKALQAQKKEIKTRVAAVRRVARVQSAQAGNSEFFGWPVYDSRLAANQRRAIRRAKEAALGPHEDAVEAVDRQIASVEQRITWVQRFGDAPEA